MQRILFFARQLNILFQGKQKSNLGVELEKIRFLWILGPGPSSRESKRWERSPRSSNFDGSPGIAFSTPASLLTATLLIARTAAWPQIHGPRSLFNSALGIGKHGLANWPQGETEW